MRVEVLGMLMLKMIPENVLPEIIHIDHYQIIL